MEFDFNLAESSGHELTLVSNHAGHSTYYCENCGALIVLYQGSLKIFHVPRGAYTCESLCVRSGDYNDSNENRSLKDQLKQLNEDAWARLK